MIVQGVSSRAQSGDRIAQGACSPAQGAAKSHKVPGDSRKVTKFSPGPYNTRSMSYIWRAALALIGAALLPACTTTPAAIPLADAAPGQRDWAQACTDNDGWDKPGPPFRIYGRTYYVGTCGITSLLVVSSEGHTLVDSGTEKGAEVVLANIRALGFDPADVDTILMSHEHFDHVGGMARLQAATGATIVTTAPAAAVLRSGKPGADDPQANSGHPPFAPVTGKIAELDAERPQLMSDREFTPLFTPGHTPGAMSWRWQECEGSACKTIVYADSLNPISADGYRFSDHPELVAAFRAGLAKVGASDCDILITPHPASAKLRPRLLGTLPLLDRDGCRAYAAGVSERLDQRLASEANGG